MNEEGIILVVDGDPSLRRSAVRTLVASGYVVYEAATGADALEQAKSCSPDLMLLDVVLPDMSGVEVCRQTKSDPGLCDVRVMLLSGEGAVSHEQAEGIEECADGCITRPLSNRELVARVRAILRIAQAEEAIKAERDRAQAYLDIAEVMMVALDRDGRITLVNRKGQRVLGFTAGELIGRNWFETCVPTHCRNEVQGVFARIVAGELDPVEYYENPIVTKHGEERLVAWHNAILRNADGRPTGTLSSGEDITERKRAEEELRKSEARFRSVFEHSPLGKSFTGVDGSLMINPAFQAMLGYTADELRAMTWQEITHPEDVALSTEVVESLLAGKRDRACFEKRYIRKDGTAMWAEVHTALQPDAEGRPLFFITSINDITERRRAADALAAERIRLRALLEAIPVPLCLLGPKYEIRFFNSAFVKTFDEPRGRPCYAVLKDRETPCSACPTLAVLSTKMPRDGEWTDRRGRVFTVLDRPFTDEDGSPLVLELFVDITDRRRAELALEIERNNLQAITRAAPVALFVVDQQEEVIHCNPAAERLFGRGMADLNRPRCGDLISCPHRLEDPRGCGSTPYCEECPLYAAIREALQGATGVHSRELEMEIETPRGRELRWFIASVEPLRLDGRRHAVAAIHDITERKRTEEELLKGEERFRQMFDNMSSGVAVYEVVGDGEDFLFKDFNRAAERIDRLAKQDVIGKSVTDLFPGVGKFGLLDVFRRVWRTGVAEPHHEAYYRDGRIAGWRENYVYTLPSREIVAIYDDVTDRRQAEDTLRQSEENLRNAQRVAHVGSWAWHIPTNTVEWSDQMYQIFGIDKDVFTGDLNEVIVRAIHPDDRAAVERSNRSVIQDRTPMPLEYRVVHPDGSVRVVWAEAGELHLDENGEPLLLTGIVQDITERKQVEQRISAALAEKEVLLREIHHRVKNNLQAVISLISIHADRVGDDDTRRYLLELQEQTRTMALVHEHLYQSEDLAEVEMQSFLETLLFNLLQAFGAGRHVTTTVEAQGLSADLAVAMPLGLVVNELVTNALKYAFPNGIDVSASIKVSLGRIGDNWELAVSDNGVGLPSELDWRHADTMGLHLVRLWATHQLGGMMDATVSVGTTFTIEFPCAQRRGRNG